MTGIRTYDLHLDDERISAIMASKEGQLVSVCIPCRNEEATIGPIVRAIQNHLVDGLGIVDELIVLDDRSGDSSAEIAAREGARVVRIKDVHRLHGEGHGKGNALWASLVVSTGDVVVWLDGDVTNFDHDWVVRLLAPIFDDESVALVKAHYHRPVDGGGGGRTTELVARPMLSLLYPELANVIQPLAGEYAIRRPIVETVPLFEGWGVEVGLLIDVARRYGAESIIQVDLGTRTHRHRSLDDLSVQAAEIIAVLHRRLLGPTSVDMARPSLTLADGSVVTLNLAERRPVSEVVIPPSPLVTQSEDSSSRAS